jgi:hypothetical protein
MGQLHSTNLYSPTLSAPARMFISVDFPDPSRKRYKLTHLKANFETRISLCRLKG